MNPPPTSSCGSPLYWVGGKTRLLDFILPLLPFHARYVEVFGGSAGLLFAKAPSSLDVYNEIEPGLVNFMTVLKSPHLSEQLIRAVQLTPYSREEYALCNEAYPASDPVEWARQFYVLVRQAHAAKFRGTWGYGTQKTYLGHYRGIERLRPARERLKHVRIHNSHFRDLFQQYDHEHTLWYLDPPYLPTQRKGRAYAHEMTHDDHVELLGAATQLRGMVMISGYPSSLYSDALHSWFRHEKVVPCNLSYRKAPIGSTSRKPHRLECLWLNPAASNRLGGSSHSQQGGPQ